MVRVNQDLSEVLQTFLRKFMSGEPLQLYQNEIMGIDAIDWDAFPKALIAEDETLRCITKE